MNELRAKMPKDGRLLIPVALRRKLHINPGTEVIFRIDNEELRIATLKSALKKAREIVREDFGKKSLSKILKAMRKKDYEDEQKNNS